MNSPVSHSEFLKEDPPECGSRSFVQLVLNGCKPEQEHKGKDCSSR